MCSYPSLYRQSGLATFGRCLDDGEVQLEPLRAKTGGKSLGRGSGLGAISQSCTCRMCAKSRLWFAGDWRGGDFHVTGRVTECSTQPRRGQKHDDSCCFCAGIQTSQMRARTVRGSGSRRKDNVPRAAAACRLWSAPARVGPLFRAHASQTVKARSGIAACISPVLLIGCGACGRRSVHHIVDPSVLFRHLCRTALHRR